MTPLRCSMEIADFLRSRLELGETGQVYAGFLPLIASAKPEEKKKRCPSVVVRAVEAEDTKEASTIFVLIQCLTYDEDMMYGSEGLYHLLEAIRYELLSHNPISDRYLIDLKENSLLRTVPDQQPYPCWWGTIEFTVNIPQPSNKRVINQFTR